MRTETIVAPGVSVWMRGGTELTLDIEPDPIDGGGASLQLDWLQVTELAEILVEWLAYVGHPLPHGATA